MPVQWIPRDGPRGDGHSHSALVTDSCERVCGFRFFECFYSFIVLMFLVVYKEICSYNVEFEFFVYVP